VLKLFNMVSPHTAIFGKKDYQQYWCCADMVKQLALPVEIVSGGDGARRGGLASQLAQRLSLRARSAPEAPRLSQCLRAAKDEVLAGKPTSAHRASRDGDAGEQRMAARLRLGAQAATFSRDGSDDRGVWWCFAAAFLGRTRLIDNVR